MSLLVYLALAVRVSSVVWWREQKHFPCSTSSCLGWWLAIAHVSTVEADAYTRRLGSCSSVVQWWEQQHSPCILQVSFFGWLLSMSHVSTVEADWDCSSRTHTSYLVGFLQVCFCGSSTSLTDSTSSSSSYLADDIKLNTLSVGVSSVQLLSSGSCASLPVLQVELSASDSWFDF